MFQTEFELTQPESYVDGSNLHCKGVMRLAAAIDKNVFMQDRVSRVLTQGKVLKYTRPG